MRLLNISEFEHISTTRNSYFDPEMMEESSKCQFLNLLVRRLTMPVMPEKQNQDYLVTQVVADYLSQPRFNLDGILFPSAQNAEADKTDAQNVILLYQSSDVMHIETDRYASLWEWEDDNCYLSPHIVAHQATPESHAFISGRESDTSATLKLNVNTIEVHDIRGVAYETEVYPVEYIERNA